MCHSAVESSHTHTRLPWKCNMEPSSVASESQCIIVVYCWGVVGATGKQFTRKIQIPLWAIFDQCFWIALLWKDLWAGGDDERTTGNRLSGCLIISLTSKAMIVKFCKIQRTKKKNVINRFCAFQNNVSVPEQLKTISFSFPLPFLAKSPKIPFVSVFGFRSLNRFEALSASNLLGDRRG